MKLDLKETDFLKYHSYLMPYAYNIVGDSQEAEDVVQEILSSFFMSESDHVLDPMSYLRRSVINRSITARQSIGARKARHSGQWLPSPLNTEETIHHQIDKDQILSYSLLVLLERLNPKERAVFILKESFEFAHGEIAALLDLTEEHSRQLYKRARQKLEPDFVRTATYNKKDEAIVYKLINAILDANIGEVKQLLAEDVTSMSDGGSGKAAPNIIHGPDHVAKFLQAMYGKYLLPDSEYFQTTLNHQPAILFTQNNVVYRCIIFEVDQEIVQSVSIIVDPGKLMVIRSK